MSRAAGDPHARLLADVGGTNVRFGWQGRRGAAIDDIAVLPCADYASLSDAIGAYLQRLDRAAPAHCAIAIANPIVGDTVRMTNRSWTFSIAALKAHHGFERLLLLNDFSALALALPSLRADELRQVGGAAPLPDAARALIGPGTGLGVSGLLPDGAGGWVALEGEGGHGTMAARTPREQSVLQWLDRRYGHASAERAVCGQGLVDLHHALTELDHGGSAATPLRDAADVTAGAEQGDPVCREAVALFCAFLGTAAGNLALTLGSRGGVYIGGGIVPRLGPLFDASPFRERFEAKGRFRGYLSTMPVFVIQATRSPALLGAANALDAMST
jgi:glucokinase